MHTPVELMRQKMIAARPPESQSRRKSIMYQVRVSQNSNTKWIYLENKKKISLDFFLLRSRSGNGHNVKGREGQSQNQSSSESSKLKDLDLHLVFHLPTTTNYYLGF